MSSAGPESASPAAHGNRQLLNRLIEIPFHPVLFFSFPILSLLAWNIEELYPGQAARSLLLSLLLCAVLWAILGLAFRDMRRAALLTSLIGLLIFTYGHVYHQIEYRTVAGVLVGRHRYLLAGWCAMLLLLGWLIVRRAGSARPATQLVNLVAVAMVMMPLVSIAGFYANVLRAEAPRATRLPSVTLKPPPGQPLPDIYYIILDGYARSDYLANDGGYDNSEFIDFLEQQGFYVAEESRSNHNLTALSLASSLNMTFAQYLGAEMQPGFYPTPFTPLIHDNLVRRSLEGIGYRSVGLQSGYYPTEWVDADLFLGPALETLPAADSRLLPNAFESMLIDSTLLQPLLESRLLSLPTAFDFKRYAGYSRDLMRAIILGEFDNLQQLPRQAGPKLVFAHIISPHSPFLFGPNGEPLEAEGPFTLVEDAGSGQDGPRLYRDQVIFISGKAEETIAAILAGSEVPPVIILQADHGARAFPYEAQRTAILNAILIREDCRSSLYSSITPINTFRVVFNCYFDADLPIVEDEIYWSPSPPDNPYEFRLPDFLEGETAP